MTELLHRQGYGATMNCLWIDLSNNTIKKQACTSEGLQKIQAEQHFFSVLKTLPDTFPIPDILQQEANGYTMKYYRNYKVLADCCTPERISRVFSYLHELHTKTKLDVSKDLCLTRVHDEIVKKVLSRFQSIEHEFSPAIAHIKTINGKPIPSLQEAVQYLWTRCESYFQSRTTFSFSLLHGDPNFQNILVGPDNSFVFIDPRGYFGQSQSPYGVSEYDRAKVVFALTGYDIFDRWETPPPFQIDTDGNCTIDSLEYTPGVLFAHGELEEIFAISIWLGNPHVFWKTGQHKKAIWSYLYAMGFLVQSQDRDGIR